MTISSVTSESLQAKLRQLLPSQQGFGSDLSASDTIIPVIDLTEAAEGSDVRVDLQTALAFGSNTSFAVANANTTIISTTGFFRVIGTSVMNTGGTARLNKFIINDGTTDKIVWSMNAGAGTTDYLSESYDFNVFLRAGDSLIASSSNSLFILAGSTRQIADVNGNLTNPVGFTPS